MIVLKEEIGYEKRWLSEEDVEAITKEQYLEKA
jgi:hypothetical protein